MSKRLFTLKERQQIQEQIANGASLSEIGRLLGRNKSSINTEVTRGGGKKDYNAKISHFERDSKSQNRRIYDLNEKLENLQQQVDILFDLITKKESIT